MTVTKQSPSSPLTDDTVCAGTVAVVSLMTGAIVAQETEAWKAGRSVIPAVEMNATTTTTAAPVMSTVFAALDGNATTATKAATTTGYDAEEEVFRIKIATTVAFITGLAQVNDGNVQPTSFINNCTPTRAFLSL